MSFDNRPLMVEFNAGGFLFLAEQLDRAKSSLGMSYILGQGGPAQVLPGGITTEHTFVSYLVPAGLLGPRGQLRVTTQWDMTGSVNVKTFRHRLGGFDFAVGRQITAATAVSMTMQRTCANRGTQGAQVSSSHWQDYGQNTSVTAVGAVDTSIDQVLSITGQCAMAGESITLQSWLVEVFPS